MLQSLRNRRNRKGFTLAELLIVVAIIAVLVAIAVPLFVGALSDAEAKVKDANIRAVRGAAVSEILTGKDSSKYMKQDGEYYDSDNKCWYASATVTADGTMKDLKILDTCPDKLGKEATGKVTLSAKGYCEKEGDSTDYTVYVAVFEAKMTDAV